MSVEMLRAPRFAVLIVFSTILNRQLGEGSSLDPSLSEIVKRPHIIVILADDLGWNDVGFHGSDEMQTPNIDALAYNGVILSKHYSMATCTPSRAALLTGRYPIRTGMQGTPIAAGMRLGIPLNETLLPQHLKRLGYSTNLVGKWHVGCYSEEYLPTKRGFDTFFGYYNGYIGYYDGMHIDSGVGGLDVRRNEKPAWSELVGKYATRVLNEEAVQVIRRHGRESERESPLFLEVSHLAPHSGNVGGRLQVPNESDNDKQFHYINDHKRRLYAGMVKELDDSVGNIVAALDEARMLEDSIIVFISDNGAPTFEPLWGTGNSGSNWPLRGEKASLHEGGIRTVGAIWSTRIARSSSVFKETFHLVDWLPTLYSAAGGDINDLIDIDGLNHWDSIANSDESGTISENMKINRTLLLNIDDREKSAALIEGKWKLIKNNQSSILAFANGYFGTKGSGPDIPKYNISAVIGTKTNKLFGNINPNLNFEMADSFLQLRIQSTVVCDSYDNNLEPQNECYDSPCLFNLENDPCEIQNVAEKYSEITKTMKETLDRFWTQIRPRRPYIIDPASHPKYFNSYWSVWVPTDNSNLISGGRNLSFDSSLLVVFSFLLFFNGR